MVLKLNNSKESLSKDDYYDKLAEEYVLYHSDVDYFLMEDCLRHENNPFKDCLI